jgi:cytochrome c biogenesis protein CcmG, thiol:disulfide interchange protein DsbE
MTRYLPLAVLGMLTLLFALPLLNGSDPAALDSAIAGHKAPPLPVPLDGRETLVNFFASWCVPCAAEHPVLQDIAARKTVRVIGIAYKDKTDATAAWLAERGNPYDALGHDDGKYAIEWGVTGVPETFLVAADGTVLRRHAGPLTLDAWKEMRP